MVHAPKLPARCRIAITPPDLFEIMKQPLAVFFVWLTALTTAPSAAEIDFAHDIAPVLREHCGKCHTGDAKKGGLSFNTRESLLAGGESGKAISVGKSTDSDFIKRLTTEDTDLRMPPEGPRVPAEKVALLKRWVDSGLNWEEGFTFGKRAYEPPLKPRRPELPAATDNRTNPIDRVIDTYLTTHKIAPPKTIDDATFARRVYLDLIGLLPTSDELETFLKDTGTDKRVRLVQSLLARDIDYAEHWLTFWNDLLRNDYTGTGFITGGRKQISGWLYAALVNNMPYDQLARELIAPPSDASRGFIDGIKWRGEVSAGQTVEIQFAQSVSQSFLGINLKCASCHDSFIDRWKLDESYGLAAIYASRPLEIHRCDKPIGKTAEAGWLFPELGQVDRKAAQPERLKQLAGLMTHPENGRFTRTIVNRLWHRLMGRGIVHPTDAMQTEPWSADLLDYLAVHLADQKYDLKQTLALIATSQTYQSQTQTVERGTDDAGYVFRGPRAKRLTAEQFMDSVWQLTGSAPARIDAPVLRGKARTATSDPVKLNGKWIWAYAEIGQVPANETIVFRKKFTVKQLPPQAIGVATCDNSYVLYVNGQRAQDGAAWDSPDAVPLTNRLKSGANEFLIVAKNGGSGPNPAGLFFEAYLAQADGAIEPIATDATWEWTRTEPQGNGRFKTEPTDWKSAEIVSNQDIWSAQTSGRIATSLHQGASAASLMVRASLVKSDFLMRSLGRPNRDQIVTVRPDELSTLEAIDLSNGQVLADVLSRGAQKLAATHSESPADFVHWLFQFAISREPTPSERKVLLESFGDKLTTQGIEDALWAVVMLPEFQLVR